MTNGGSHSYVSSGRIGKVLLRVCVLLLLVLNSGHELRAQVNIDSGFFINNSELQSSSGYYGVAFSGNIDDERSSLGMSLRVGSFIFGLETLQKGGFGQSGSLSASNGAVSAGFATQTGPQHRAMMGLKLTRNMALYGFHGLMGYTDNRNLSYNTSSETTKKIFVGPGCVYEFVTATHSTSGSDAYSYDGFQNVIGAGIESLLFGGVLRVEYNMSHRKGLNQNLKLNNSTSDSRVANSSTLNNFSYNWKSNTEQVIQLRWKTTF